jgi:hypothetical protein
MYALIITIDNADARNAVIGTIRGSGSVLDLIEGRDQEPGTNPPIYNRYVLKPSLLPNGTPEIPAVGWVGLNTGVPAVVRNEYSQNSAFWRTVEFGSVSYDRAQMLIRMRQLAVENGATHAWEIIPGQSLTGDLLSKFTALA